jgi:YgiT-type zinc finger domain-containing protein
MKENVLCSCGDQMTHFVDTVSHSLFGKEVKLHDVPHFKCENCGRSTYANQEMNVFKMLKEAYLDGFADVKYQQ